MCQNYRPRFLSPKNYLTFGKLSPVVRFLFLLLRPHSYFSNLKQDFLLNFVFYCINFLLLFLHFLFLVSYFLSTDVIKFCKFSVLFVNIIRSIAYLKDIPFIILLDWNVFEISYEISVLN